MEPRLKPLTASTDLVLERCDLELEANGRDHHTADLCREKLVVRRGQPFWLTLHFEGRNYEAGMDSLTFCAVTGESHARTSLFSDAVYLDSDEERREYVLTQQGFIYQGSAKFIKSIPWNFGQFEDGILDICLMLLDVNPKFLRDAGRDCSRRSSPVYVGRVVSGMVNCNDDQGVLLGRWDNNYRDGISPMFWIGSVDILRRWKNDGCQRVKYGQCWVFAAVACTGERHAGCERAWNRPWLLNGIPESKAIWSVGFRLHVVELWKILEVPPSPQPRLILPSSYSQPGTYCCGPVPVRAIKVGDLSTKYDAPFVFAEVNADVVDWIRQDDGSMHKSINHSLVVGQKISTKSVGRDQREDITHTYKYPEGSAEEREAFARANHQNKLAAKEETGVAMRIRAGQGMNRGSDFDVFAHITNNTAEDHTGCLLLCARTVSYNGILGPECGTKDLLNFSLGPFSEKSIPLRILYEKYCDCLTESNLIKVRGLFVEQAANSYLLAERDIYLENPEIKIRILGEPKQNCKLVAEVSLWNPLTVPLSGCTFTVEGAGLTDEQKTVEIPDPVEAGAEVKVRVDLLPRNAGRHKLVVNFESDRLKAVKGFRNVIINTS
ncbi:hypothetical protein E2I00_004168 [Balaenoptera physalus]|uniref:Transglutaminase-like domain-containing protein n=1 Tax=Balaenoptera physalus TaxID=9770 RepID=A0A643CFU2_BALPH|nr:hypothetical protein E2I00_004168 [Balaenoptera physalus]